MANDYYSPTDETRLTLARAGNQNSERAAVEAGFDLLPAPDRFKERNANYIACSGTATAYTATLATPAPTAYAAGMRLDILPPATNTGAFTLNLNGLGAKQVLTYAGATPDAGMAIENIPVAVVYDGTAFRLMGEYSATTVAAGQITVAMLAAEVLAYFHVNDSVLGLTSGATINWDSGDVVITHSANALTITGGNVDVQGTFTADNVIVDSTTIPAVGIYRPAADTLGFAVGGAGEVQLTSTALSPMVSNGSALGTSSLMWSDAYFASGAVLDFNNGNITVTHSSAMLSIASTLDTAAVGPTLELYRDSASPATADLLGRLQFSGENALGTKETYASITAVLTDATDGDEEAALIFRVMANGSISTDADSGSYVQIKGVDQGARGTLLLDIVNRGDGSDDGDAMGFYWSVDGSPPQLNDAIAKFRFYGSDGVGGYDITAEITVEAEQAGLADDMPGRIVFSTTADAAATVTERMRINSKGGVFIGTTDTDLTGNTTSANAGVVINQTGSTQSLGLIQLHRDSGAPLQVNRTTNDGTLIEFYQGGTLEGSIDVAGTTVSLTGGHLSRWTQWDGTEPAEQPRGTILANADAMCEWYEALFTVTIPAQPERLDANRKVVREAIPEQQVEKTIPYYGAAGDGGTDTITYEGVEYLAAIRLCPNDQLNRMVVSGVVADTNVAGVLQGYDNADGEPLCAQSGDFVIRVAPGYAITRGMLLESNGDGCARPQSDTLVRSSTVAKVSSAHVSQTYPDGSFLVPCILMCGG